MTPLNFCHGHGPNFGHLITIISKIWPWSCSKIVDHLTITPWYMPNGKKSLSSSPPTFLCSSGVYIMSKIKERIPPWSRTNDIPDTLGGERRSPSEHDTRHPWPTSALPGSWLKTGHEIFYLRGFEFEQRLHSWDYPCNDLYLFT